MVGIMGAVAAVMFIALVVIVTKVNLPIHENKNKVPYVKVSD